MRQIKNMSHFSPTKKNSKENKSNKKKSVKTYSNTDIKKNKILEEIRNCGINGISMKKLCTKHGYPRSTVNRLITAINKKAQKDGGEIIYKEYNKGNLVISSQIAKNTKLQVDIYGRESTREILGGTLLYSLFPGELDLPQEFKVIKKIEDSFFNNISKYRSDLTKDAKFLFEFSLKIASIINFILIHSIRPSTDDEEREWIDRIKKGDYFAIKEWRKKKMDETYTWILNSINMQIIFNEFNRQDIVIKGKLIKEVKMEKLIRKIKIEKLIEDIDTRIMNINKRQPKGNQSKIFRKTQIEELGKDIDTKVEYISRIKPEANLINLFEKTQIEELRRNHIEELKKYTHLPIEEITMRVNKKGIGLNTLIPIHEVDYKTFQSLQEGYKQIWPYTFKVLQNLLDSHKLSGKIEDQFRMYYRSKKQEKKTQKNKRNVNQNV